MKSSQMLSIHCSCVPKSIQSVRVNSVAEINLQTQGLTVHFKRISAVSHMEIFRFGAPGRSIFLVSGHAVGEFYACVSKQSED